MSHIDPTKVAFAALKGMALNHPVEMINLVRLREKAIYDDRRDATGQEAYRQYGQLSAPVFQKVGGSIVWSAQPEHMVIGPPDEFWHVAFVARYPTGQAFIDMVYDADYRAIVFHRQAAVETSRLIRTKPREGENGFG